LNSPKILDKMHLYQIVPGASHQPETSYTALLIAVLPAPIRM
jgi:hypothetical protein